MGDAFTWQDGERTIRFGRGTIATAGELLGTGYTLLTTPRAEAAAPAVVAAAAHGHHVRPGRVDEIAEELRGDGRRRAARRARGRARDRRHEGARRRGRAARPRRGDPDHAQRRRDGARAPARGRRAAGHPERPPRDRHQRSGPVGLPAARGARRERRELARPRRRGRRDDEGLARAGPRRPGGRAAHRGRLRLGGEEPDRDALALAALLSGYTIDQSGLALHHVLCQTIVRLAGGGHGPTNAAMLPTRSARCAAGTRATVDATELARDLARRAGAERLRDIGVDQGKLEDCVEAAAQRPQLKLTPPPADADEIRALYEAAW